MSSVSKADVLKDIDISFSGTCGMVFVTSADGVCLGIGCKMIPLSLDSADNLV